MKKIILSFFAVFLLTSAAYAADVSLSISDTCGAFDEEIYVSVSIGESKSVIGSVKIQYDPSVLQPISAINVGGLSGSFYNLSYSDTEIRFNWYGNGNPVKAGELYRLGFKVLSKDKVQSSISISKAELYDLSESFLTYDSTAGSVYLNGFYPFVEYSQNGAEAKELETGQLDIDIKLFNGTGAQKSAEVFFVSFDNENKVASAVSRVYNLDAKGIVSDGQSINITSDIKRVRVFCWDYLIKGNPCCQSFDIERK